MNQPTQCSMGVCLVVIGAVVAMAALAGAQTPGPGQATGRFTVDRKSFGFGYAYAQLEPDRQGKEVLWVLLTEKPVSADQLAGRLRDIAASEQLNALAFALDPTNEPSSWRWHHPALSIGCGFCSDLQFKPSTRSRDEIAGTVFSAKPQSFQKQMYEFRVSFAARIQRPSEAAGTTAAEKSAIKNLRQLGVAFRPADFYLHRTDPQAIRLFLDAGMKPDTVAPGMTETLLLDVLGSDCSDGRVRAVALMLIGAGADPNYRSPEGAVPLLRAGLCADLVEALLEAGAKLTLPSSIEGETVGRTVMEGAIGFERPDVVRVLIEHGYDVKRDGARLMDRARRAPEIQKILREAGAASAAPATRAAAADSAARPPASTAARGAPGARSPELARRELAQRKLPFTQAGFWDRLTALDASGALLFLEAGIPPSVRRSPPQNDTPLLFVTSTGCGSPDEASKAAAADIALALIAHKADVSAKDDNDTTPLIHAAESCPSTVVRALLQSGASTKAKSRGGATPMMLAVLSDRDDNVRALLDGGYDVSGELPGLLPLAAGKPKIEALLKRPAAKQPR